MSRVAASFSGVGAVPVVSGTMASDAAFVGFRVLDILKPGLVDWAA